MNKNTKVLFLDVDGTLTDGKIYMGNDGEMCKAFDIKDGCGIHDILPHHNIVPVVITARESRITANRCAELGIEHCYQGVRNKAKKLEELADLFNLKKNDCGEYPGTAYMGDDIIDIECMQLCEKKGCPSDAAKEVKAIAEFISTKTGGNGAVREFIEWLVEREL